MNWTFNQNCQLIIDETPDKNGYIHLLEVLFFPDGTHLCFSDRNSPIVEYLPKDGLYIYRYLLTNEDPSNIDISKIPASSNSIGDWTGFEEIFSICHLRKCAIAHEKQAIEEFLSTCNKKNCNQKSSQQAVRDVLLISIFVLENLIVRQRYSEAEDILERLGSCGNLCEDVITKTCCCNG